MGKDFKTALQRVLEHEGGYVNHPSDPGGETNFGITKNTAKQYGYTGSMRLIPADIVEEIYKQQFWNTLDCSNYHYAFGFQLFDAGVNHGIGNARKMLQRAVGVKDDGVIGAITLDAISKIPTSILISLFNAERIQFYTKLSTFASFGKGWMSRMVGNLRYVAEDLG